MVLKSPSTETDRSRIHAAGGMSADTYGEITPKGIEMFARRVQLCKDDVFCDLGSGNGGATIQCVRDLGARRSCGVELARARHACASCARAGAAGTEARDGGVTRAV